MEFLFNISYRLTVLTVCPLVMQLLHFTQITLYALLNMYLLRKLLVVDIAVVPTMKYGAKRLDLVLFI